ncbi:hypothetical protein MKY41_02085 [Sporosarcina sp. FSL W7-1349]|uniref:hypothetical protein n=1 Tax=Sporosarcina sp. FSL W7-1349 TaxID=2921561 RepID=UPI0030F86C3D
MLLVDVLKGFIYDIESNNYSHRAIRGYRNKLSFFRFIATDFEIEEVEDVRSIHIESSRNTTRNSQVEIYVKLLLDDSRKKMEETVKLKGEKKI